MLGRTLDHYRIESKLGEGGMGVVYKAWDGGPGGTIYEGELSRTGEYRIWVERRLPSKSSSFALELACDGR